MAAVNETVSGTVIAPPADGLVRERLEAGHACAGCGACAGGRQAQEVLAETERALAAGDRVRLDEQVSPLRAALLLFALPLGLALLAAALTALPARLLGAGTPGTLLAALAGGLVLAASWAGVAAWMRRHGPRAAWRVRAIVPPAERADG